MEIKYEPVFGPQHLFKLPSTEIIVVGPHGDKTESNIDLMIGNTPDDYVIVAMRRIISDPKRWTWEDKKAGRLPEVGCKCIWVNKSGEPGPEGMKYPKNGCEVEIIAHYENYNNSVAVFKFKTEEGMHVAVSVYVDDFKPIESPEEKAARLREEWCANAAKQLKNLEYSSTLASIYDALLSGDLPVPGKE